MNNKIILFTALLLSSLLVSVAFGDTAKVRTPLTLSQLMNGMADYEKKEVLLTGTIAGACTSGCKVWVSEGQYKKGDTVALVWAKDKAFQFNTDATGRKVLLKGFAVGKYIDLCALEKGEQAKAAADGKAKEGCKPVIETETGTKQLSSITFFATSVEYLD